MLRWRIIIGIPLVAVTILLCRLDALCSTPGLFLTPFYLICVFLMCRETLHLLNAGGIWPRRSTVCLGVLGTVLLCWLSCLVAPPVTPDHRSRVSPSATELDEGADSAGIPKLSAALSEEESYYAETAEWKTAAYASLHIMLAMAVGVLIAFVGEMLRFKLPGGHLINLSGAVFAIAYIGLLGSFLLIMRMAYGVIATLSVILIAKSCDLGGYIAGKTFGRHKMAPSLSPGKTLEGLAGGLTLSVLVAAAVVKWVFPLASGAPSPTSWLGIVAFGLAVGATGALGDLAESLIKRDVARKDSGVNIPGFGGVLDVFDSILLAAPVAFGLFAFKVVQI